MTAAAKSPDTTTENEKDVWLPRPLQDAFEALQKVCDNTLTDALSNHTTENYRAIVQAVAECRELLCEIEASALTQLKREAAYHRDILQSIESLQLNLDV